MFEIQIYGDRGVRVQLGTEISQETNDKIRSFTRLLEKEKITGVIEWIPTYTALSIYYDPAKVTFNELQEKLTKAYQHLAEVEIPPAEVMTIPVCYGGAFGPDLGFVAKHHGLSEEEVIQIHTGRDYLIYMMGFSPGFPYLGGMSQEIATPRLKTPRMKIPAGSVGIAGEQTGIYPSESPGGWQIIGQTPIELYNPAAKNPILLETGNYIRFQPVSLEEFEAIKQSINEANN